MRRYGLPLLALALAAAGLARDAVLSAEGAATSARLIAVSSTADGSRAAVLIEASEPVAYLTAQPDPSTLVVDLRNVTAAGYANGVSARSTGPIRGVTVDERTTAGGERVASVRVTLDPDMRPRVRSQRNLIFVELEAAAALSAVAPTTGAAGPARGTELKSVRSLVDVDGTSLVLTANGALAPGSVQRTTEQPYRLVLDFPDVTPAVPGVTSIKQGPVERVRVALNSRDPLVTRVVVDLNRNVGHSVEAVGDGGKALRLRFDDSGDDGCAAGQPCASPETATATGLDPMKALEQGVSAGDPSPPAAAPAPLSVSQGPEPAPVVESAPSSSHPSPDVAAGGASRPPAPLTPGQESTVSRTGERTFSGHPVSLDFQGADLRAVLRTFAEISGLNIVIDPAVQGSVDVALRDVPWDQALDIILRANKLGYFVDGTIVRVAPLTVLAEEEKQRRKLAEEQALSGELRVMTKTLSYARAEEVSPLITKSALTPRGTVQVDPRTNTLIISDLQQALETASTLIATLDQPQPQVEIEARIVQTNSSFLRDIGVSWGFNGEVSPRLGNTTPLAFPNRGALGGATGGVQGTPGGSPVGNAVDLGVPGATSAIGLALGSVNGAFNLDLALSALERTGRGRILSTPRVSTQNNIEAEITQGVQIPIQTVANNTVTVTFKDAALTLKVTPQITTAGTVIMKIVVENAQADFSRSVNGIPPIDTQRALTQVLVSDGQTTVIGGIYLNTEQQVNDRTPALHRMPLLGWLFRKDRVEDSNRELLIFVTPRIIKT